MCVSLGNHTEMVDEVAQSSSAGFVGPNFVLALITVWPYFEVVQKGSSDAGSILVSALSSFPPRSIGVRNSNRVFNHLSVSNSLLRFCLHCGLVCLGRNFLSR